MVWPRVRTAILAAVTALAAVSGISSAASACSLVQFKDDGRYVGGDLVAQIVSKAELIQIVRVSEKRIVNRSFSLGGWYYDFGTLDLPADRPEYVDQFVFSIEPVDTLKGTLTSEPWLLEQNPRVLGFDPAAWGAELGTVASPKSHPNQLPTWLFDRPANGGYAFTGADEHSGGGSGECSEPYLLEVGQLLIALRRSDGRLYPATGAFPLGIDAELTSNGRRRRLTFNMQSLIPIGSIDDPTVTRFRDAIGAAK